MQKVGAYGTPRKKVSGKKIPGDERFRKRKISSPNLSRHCPRVKQPKDWKKEAALAKALTNIGIEVFVHIIRKLSKPGRVHVQIIEPPLKDGNYHAPTFLRCKTESPPPEDIEKTSGHHKQDGAKDKFTSIHGDREKTTADMVAFSHRKFLMGDNLKNPHQGYKNAMLARNDQAKKRPAARSDKAERVSVGFAGEAVGKTLPPSTNRLRI